jgi:hypothetical protein
LVLDYFQEIRGALASVFLWNVVPIEYRLSGGVLLGLRVVLGYSGL